MARRLTRRQIEVIRYSALGMRDKEIAEKLKIAPRTVQTFSAQLRDRLGAFDRVLFPGIAMALGILTVEEVCAPARTLLKDIPPEDDSVTRHDRHEGAD